MPSSLASAWRQLTQRPLQSSIAVLTLALGIGATTAMFSVLKPVLVEPLPHAQADRLHVLAPYPWMHAEVVQHFAAAAGDTAVAGYYPKAYAVMAGEQPIEVQGADVTPAFFEVLGMPLLAGRTFSASGEASVAVVGASLARRLFGDSASALGRDLMVDGGRYRVVGVTGVVWQMPQLDEAQLWLPLDLRAHAEDGAPNWMIPVLRLGEGVDTSVVQAQLASVLERHLATGAELPRSDYRWQRLREVLVGDQGRPLLLLQLAVGLVLVLACANVAILQKARVSERVAEMGLRRALGASRARLVRQVMLESLLLSLIAGVVTVLALMAGIGVLAGVLPVELARFGAPTLDAGLVLFAFGVALAAGLFSATLPALWASRVGAVSALRDGTRSVAGTRSGRRGGTSLMAVEIAMTLVLLIGAGLLLRSFYLLSTEAPGFRSDGVLVMPLRLPDAQHDSVAALDATWQDLLDRVAGTPGVLSAALANRVPLARGGTTRLFMLEGESEPRIAQAGIVSPGYIETLDIPLLRGRFIDESDRRGSEKVMVIDAALWRQLWPEQDPIGKRMRLLMGGDDHWLTVVGVVGDIRGSGLAAAPAPGFYLAQQQRPDSATSLAVGRRAVILVRSAGAADTMAQSLREAVWSQQPQLAVPEVVGLDEVLRQSVAPQRFRAGAVGVFAAMALLLATAGVYAVVSQVVGRRLREFGIRRAMGATARDLRSVVFRWTFAAALAGSALGIAGSVLLTRSLAGFLHGVSPADPAVFLIAVGVLLAAVLAATWGPAHRAARVDPMQALRES
jgi:putative ABC transport system permease protein